MNTFDEIFAGDPNMNVVLTIPKSLYTRAEASRRRFQGEDDSYGDFNSFVLSALRVAIECDEGELE